MLAKIAPRFVISGVIQNAYYANYMAVDLSKQIIGESAKYYKYDNPKRYFECNFFGYLSSLPKPTEFSDQFEAEKYDEACQKFAVYNEVKDIYEKLNEFTIEIRELFRVVEANNSSSNFFSRGQETDEVWEQDLDDCLNRYNAFLAHLEVYPEWREKVVDEVGKWFHMIHNNLAEGPSKRSIFLKMNRQEYFV